jgi:proteasome lid subunit RPN8/RPN11
MARAGLRRLERSAATVSLRIGPVLRAALRDHGQAAYPKECCGLLIGRDEGEDIVVTQVLPSVNLDPDGGARAFEVDPELILTWHKRLRGTPERIVGHYHSHPNEPARPSATDLERAWEPGMIWLILSVGRGKLTELGAFRYREEGRGPSLRRSFEPVPLVEA